MNTTQVRGLVTMAQHSLVSAKDGLVEQNQVTDDEKDCLAAINDGIVATEEALDRLEKLTDG